MNSLRRYLVFQAFALWQGGFLFYAAVVVPTGTEVLGSSAAQGFITARVTDTLNLIGLAALGLAVWDLALTRDPSRRRTTVRWWCWGVLAVGQLVLFLCHELLDSYLDPTRSFIENWPPFRPVHRVYLWTSTIQWCTGLGFAWATLRAWAADGTQRPPATPLAQV
jgi:hypothetical protein